ncbi:MAG: hypothetical protein Ta2F_18000 [Termitinemataceae bacterium]|nr:MAG: hypothetical protein Ta2F_18000 [Termitinemataceae bacterium]
MSVYQTEGGYLLLENDVDYDYLLDFIIETNYEEEFCLSLDFQPHRLDKMMKAGFLVMSTAIINEGNDPKKIFILLPKHHKMRSILFFDNLHIGKTVKRFLKNYELKIDTDFDEIISMCIHTHGDDWLTRPLIESLKQIRENEHSLTRPFSFALYRGSKLTAGEFGVVSGRVYTSYSGYYIENNAGRVQMILTAIFLRDNGFAFWDLGMPLDYKYSLGVHDVDTKKFLELFRGAQ